MGGLLSEKWNKRFTMELSRIWLAVWHAVTLGILDDFLKNKKEYCLLTKYLWVLYFLFFEYFP